MRHSHAPRHRIHRRSVIALAVSTALPILLAPALARALDVSTGPAGANVILAKSTFTLGGTGVRVGQFEPGEPRTTHNTITGRVTARGNTAFPNDDHANGVASIFVGANFNPGGGNPIIEGVANAATLFSSGYQQFQRPGNAADLLASLDWLGTNNVRAVNWSGAFFNPGNTFIAGEGGNGVEAMMLDAKVRTNDWLFCKSAGNQGTGGTNITVPGDAYNILTVGATGATAGGGSSEDYTRVANYSSRGSTSDGRRKPEIVAPGSNIFMAAGGSNTATQTASGTSFATPHVAGTAALLEQWAVREGLNSDRLSKKAMLLNGASKHVRDPNDGDRAWPLWRAATADTIPMNNAMGVGRLNAVASVRNYVGGSRTDLMHQGSTITGVGTEQKLSILGALTNKELNKGALVTATLVWERNVTITDPANPQLAASYNRSDLTNLNLLLRNRTTGVEVAASRSLVDNVEHIYANVPADGLYDLVVRSESAAATSWTLAASSGGTDGLAFSVRPGARGNTTNTATAVFSNDVHWLGTSGAANYRTESEIFVSGGDGKNMQRISGALQTRSRVGPHNAPPAAMSLLNGAERGVLGLRGGETLATTDQLGDFSFGTDTSAVVLPNGEPSMQNLPSTLAFSVTGSPDVRRSAEFDTFGSYYDSSAIFMTPAAANTSVIQHTGASLGLANTDDLDALELTSPIRGDFSREADTDGDGMHNRPTFFTLSDGSPSLGVGSRTTDDIFVSLGQDPSATFGVDSPVGGFAMFTVFAEGAKLGLLPGDKLDALALCDLNLDGIVGPGDSALFSVVAGGASGLDGGSVYFTTFDNNKSLFASAAQLGIAGMDLDALDVMVAIPEPTSPALLIVLAMWTAKRRRHNCRLA